MGRVRRLPFIAAVAVLLVAALAATALLAQPVPVTAQECTPHSGNVGTKVGQCAPNFTLRGLNGKATSLASLRGHPVLIHFWAVGCTTCAGEYADFARIVRAYTRRGLTVLDVDAWGEPVSLIQGWQRSHRLPATILVDPPIAVFTRYGGIGTPTSFFVDRAGRIRAAAASPLSYTQYQQNLAKIM